MLGCATCACVRPRVILMKDFIFLPSLHLLFGDVKMGTSHNIYKEEIKWNVKFLLGLYIVAKGCGESMEKFVFDGYVFRRVGVSIVVVRNTRGEQLDCLKVSKIETSNKGSFMQLCMNWARRRKGGT